MATHINVSKRERWTSGVGGAALAAAGVKRMFDANRAAGSLLLAAGAGILWRSVTGHCPAYAAAHINTASSDSNTKTRLSGNRGVNVEEAVTIDASPAELYETWRHFEQLPRVIPDLVSVRRIDDQRSRWVARRPGGGTMEWTAEIINEIPGELIAWRSVGPSKLVSAGSVHFTPAPGHRGTIVRVRLQYALPAGKLGSAVAWVLGHEPAQSLREGLRRLKQLKEAGEIAASEPHLRGAQ